MLTQPHCGGVQIGSGGANLNNSGGWMAKENQVNKTINYCGLLLRASLDIMYSVRLYNFGLQNTLLSMVFLILP